MIANLLVINGAPGAGKSLIATRLGDIRRVDIIEIDALRSRNPHPDRDDAKRSARAEALLLASAALTGGRDVVVPQYLGRPDFVRDLRDVASRAGAAFVEVTVDVAGSVAADRFRARRRLLRQSQTASTNEHPEHEVPDDVIDETITDAIRRLQERRSNEPLEPIDGANPALAATQIVEILDRVDRARMHPPESITDGVVTVRSPRADDRRSLIELRDVEFHRWVGPGSDEPRPTMVIEHDDHVIGWVDWDVESRDWLTEGQVNVGYAVAADARRRGFGTRGARLLLHRRSLMADAATPTVLIDRANLRSLAVAERLGFVPAFDAGSNILLVGRVPGHVYSDGTVTIRPRRHSDLDADLAAKDIEQQRWLWTRAEAAQWAQMHDVERRRHTAAWLATTVDSFGRGPRWAFSVDSASAANVGSVEVDLDNEHTPPGDANVSYSVHPAHRGRGTASAAVRLVQRFLHDHTGVRSVWICIERGNTASERVAVNLGARVVDQVSSVDGRVLTRYELARTPPPGQR